MNKPNFVFIMTDTQGANVIGCYGKPELGTSNLDRLAAEGIRFERAYTTCPLCTPARGGIFTGLYPSVNGAHTNNLAPGANIPTMGQRFSDAGYRTAYIGKWHLDGLDYFDSGICPEGWEDAYWYDGRCYLADLTDEQIALWRQRLRTVEDLREHDIQPEFTWAHRCSDRAIRFLEEQRADQPFLLVVSYDEPHGPATCPPDYAERFIDYRFPIGPAARDRLENKPAHQREWAASGNWYRPEGVWTNPKYFGCNAFVDWEIGRVIEAVNRYAGENTYIIYTSDHGDMFGAHRLGGKGPTMYEEITHIPLIVRLPGHADAGTIRHDPVSHIDLLPTMLDWARIPVPPIFARQGYQSLLAASDPDRALLIEFTRYSINHDGWGGYQPIRCVVRGSHKLVINLLQTDELYDLEHDPAELNNRINDPSYAKIRDELHDALLAKLDQIRDPFRGPCWERRSWRTEQRRAWRGGYRHRPEDGYMPITLAYGTGQPPERWVEELEPH